jgi:hypothetical protein
VWLPLSFIQTTGSVDNGIDSSAALAGWYESPAYYLNLDFSSPNFTGDSDSTQILSLLYQAVDPSSLWPDWYTSGIYVDLNAVDFDVAVLIGIVANATTTTALSTVAGTQVHVGTVANATTATALSTVVGTQVHVGIVSNATSATLLSTPTGTQAQQGAVSNLASATALSTVAGIGGTVGTVANLTSATALSTVIGVVSSPGVCVGWDQGGFWDSGGTWDCGSAAKPVAGSYGKSRSAYRKKKGSLAELADAADAIIKLATAIKENDTSAIEEAFKESPIEINMGYTSAKLAVVAELGGMSPFTWEQVTKAFADHKRRKQQEEDNFFVMLL